jgi:hypothetical protein
MIKVNAMGVSNKRQGKRVAYQQQPFYIRDTGGNFVNKEFRNSVYSPVNNIGTGTNDKDKFHNLK